MVARNPTLLWGQTENVRLISVGLTGAVVGHTKQLVNVVQAVPRVWSILFSAQIIDANFNAAGHAAALHVFPFITLGLGTTNFTVKSRFDDGNALKFEWNLVGNLNNQLLWIGTWQQPTSVVDSTTTLQGQGIGQFPASTIQVGADLTWITNTPGDEVVCQCNALVAPIGGDPNL